MTHPVMGFSKDAEICGLIVQAGKGHGWVLAWVTMDQAQRNGISSLNAWHWPERGEGPETVRNWLSLIPIHRVTQHSPVHSADPAGGSIKILIGKH